MFTFLDVHMGSQHNLTCNIIAYSSMVREVNFLAMFAKQISLHQHTSNEKGPSITHLPCHWICIFISQGYCSNFGTCCGFSCTGSGLHSLLPFMWLSSLVEVGLRAENAIWIFRESCGSMKEKRKKKKSDFSAFFNLHRDVCSDLEPWNLCRVLAAHEQSWCQSNIKKLA